MTRQRTSQYPPRDDPETTIARQFTLPTARTFTLAGSASLSALIPDDEVDRLVGRTTSPTNSVRDAYSTGRLPGDVQATASATVDGDPATAWEPGLGTKAQVGSTLTYDLAKPQALSGLALQVIADGRHSVPTAMTVTSGSQVRQVTLPPIADGTVPGAVTTVPVSFPALTGSHFIVTFTGVRPEYAANYYSAGPLELPLGIAEIGIPGARANPTPASLPGTCVSNLMTIDGQPIDVALVGSTQHALDGGEAQLVPCGPDAKGITLGAGPHIVQTVAGHNPPCASTPTTCTGWNIDQLALDSAAGGGPGSGAFPTSAGTPQLPATQPGPAPTVAATSVHIDGHGADVTGATQPFELVLGQSVNKGWQAVATPGPGAPAGSHPVNLGRPQLVDGFANGWQVSAADLHTLGGSSFTVQLSWTPQREIWAALAVSAATLLICLVLGLLPLRARRWVRAHLPRRLRGPAGPEAPERPAVPFDAAVLALPGAPAPKDQRQRGWLRFPRALLIGAVTGAAALLVTPPLAGLVVAGCRDARPPGPLGPRPRQRGRDRGHRGRLHQRRPGAERPPLPGRLQLGGLVRQRRQPDLAGRRSAGGRRGDLGSRPAGEETAAPPQATGRGSERPDPDPTPTADHHRHRRLGAGVSPEAAWALVVLAGTARPFTRHGTKQPLRSLQVLTERPASPFGI